MSVGTAGFVKERLTEARAARGLTKVALAEMLDVTPAAISQYERGPHTPSRETFDRIRKKLNFPSGFFLKPVLEGEDAPIFWRSNASATKIARQRAMPRLNWLKEVSEYLQADFEFPAVAMPRAEIPTNLDETTTACIDRIAEDCREFWDFRDGPVPDLLLELENSGTITARTNMAAETLDAFSQWSEVFGRPFVVLGKEGASAVRSRFDAAHELGHLVLHRGINQRRLNTKSDWKIMETQAHRFASSFLFPAKSFVDELWTPTLDGFVAMKERWRVSIKMMIVRSRTLELVDERAARRLYINYSRRGWNVEEPFDAVLEPEEPRIIRRSFQELLDNKIRTREQLLDDLALPAAELDEMSAATPGFFAPVRVSHKALPKLRPGRAPTGHRERIVSLQDYRNRD